MNATDETGYVDSYVGIDLYSQVHETVAKILAKSLQLVYPKFIGKAVTKEYQPSRAAIGYN